MSTMERWLLVGSVLVLAWWGLSRFLTRWVESEAAQRKTFDRIMRASTPPSALGCGRDRKRVG